MIGHVPLSKFFSLVSGPPPKFCFFWGENLEISLQICNTVAGKVTSGTGNEVASGTGNEVASGTGNEVA